MHIHAFMSVFHRHREAVLCLSVPPTAAALLLLYVMYYLFILRCSY